MAKAPRHARMAQQQALKQYEYEITDKNATVDMRGEFGGAKVRHSNGKRLVTMSESAAKFYLDQGVLVRSVSDAEQPAEQPGQ